MSWPSYSLGLRPLGLAGEVSGGGGVQTYSFTASGGIVFSGTTPAAKGSVRAVSGGLSFSGQSGEIRSHSVGSSGGIVFSGTSTQIRSSIRIASGGLLFGGAATIVLTPDPTPTSQRHFKRGRRPRFRIY